MSRRFFAVLLAIFAPAIPSSARAEQELFGDAGTISPNGFIGWSFATEIPEGESTSAPTRINTTFSPGVLAFVTDGFGIGGNLQVSQSSSSSNGFSTSTVGFGLGLRIAGNIRFSDRVSWLLSVSWPVTIFINSSDSELAPSSTSTSMNIGVAVALPILFHFDNFFIGIGPSLSVDLFDQTTAGEVTTENARQVVSGISTTLGGWL